MLVGLQKSNAPFRKQAMGVLYGIAYLALGILTISCSRSSVTVSDHAAKAQSRQESASNTAYEIPSPPPGVGMQIHRKVAGEPDESGWCYAKSTEGGYSVLLPNVFADFSLTVNAQDGAEVKMFNLGTKDKQLVKFTTVAIFKRAGIKDDALDGFDEPFKNRGATVDKRDVVHAGMNGIELRIADAQSTAYFRILKNRTTMFQLAVEAPASISTSELEPDVKRFFDSF